MSLIREIAKTLLEMEGFVVETAQNGREAVRGFSPSHPPGYYDVILMDIRIAEVMDGLEADAADAVSWTALIPGRCPLWP